MGTGQSSFSTLMSHLFPVLSSVQYSVRVEKGEYTLLMRIRHEKKELLEKLSDLSLQITFKLSSELKVSRMAAFQGSLSMLMFPLGRVTVSHPS